MPDGLKQMIDKLTVMMGKLIMETMDKTDNSNHEFIKPIEVEEIKDAVTNRNVFKTGLCQIIVGARCLEEGQGMEKIIEVGQDMI